MEDRHDLATLLGGLTLFADLSHPQLEATAHTFQEQWFAKDQRILRKGLAGSGFYVIAEGLAKVVLDGKEVATLGKGDFFGEISLLLDEPPTADVVALGPLRCLVLSGPGAQEFFEANPKVMYRLLQAEAMRLRSALQWES